MKARKRRVSIAVGALLCLAFLAIWQWRAIAWCAIDIVAASVAHVRVSFATIALSPRRAVLQDVRVVSLHGEPIATLARVEVTYDLRDLFPSGRRLFGLESVALYSPHLIVVRHLDGTMNLPAFNAPANSGGVGAPLTVKASLYGGSIDVVNESRRVTAGRSRMYVRDLQVRADVASAAASHYRVHCFYGETPSALFPVRGRGDLDARNGSDMQRWTAPALPIAAAADFVINSASLRVENGMLHDLDARYFALGDAANGSQTHLAATAQLAQGRIAIEGLAAPVDAVRGTVDVYDGGLLTSGLSAAIGSVPVHVSGGLYDMRDPHLRLAVRGAGNLAQLRPIFPQAKRLPMAGPLAFSLLVEGRTNAPLVWIDLQSPRIAYATTPLDRVGVLAAFDGNAVDVVDFSAKYGRIALDGRGRIALGTRSNGIEMLAGIHGAARALPYVGSIAPAMSLDAEGLALADNPKAISMRGILWGSGANSALAGIFNVDSRGAGEIGPIRLKQGNGTAYARIALDRQRGSTGVAIVRDLPIPNAGATVNATLFGEMVGGSVSGSGVGRVASQAGEAHFGAALSGTTSAPRLLGTLVVANGRYRDFSANGVAGLAYADGTLHVRDAAAAIGPLFIAAAGSIGNLRPGNGFSPHYDLTTQIHTSDVAALLATLQPHIAQPVQGSVDADLRVEGNGSAPSVSGTMHAPEGNVNGLGFRDFSGTVRANRSSLSIAGGRVVVGDTAVSLDVAASTSHAALTARAPHADLADFDDFFDRGDMLGGTGSLALSAQTAGRSLVASNGDIHLAGAHYRQIDLGTVAAHWTTNDGTVATNVRFGGPSGTVAIVGNVTPASEGLDLRANARRVDLASWLPMLGYNEQVTGYLDAQAGVAGRYPDIAMNLRAALFNGTVGRLPVERFEIVASAAHGRGTVQSATLDVPSLHADASGTFGLRANDRLALKARMESANVGTFLDRASGKDAGISGTLDSTVYVDGTRANPQVASTFLLQSLRRGDLTIPAVRGDLTANRNAFALRNGEIDLQQGKALLTADVPLHGAPISASLVADDVELTNFATLLPKGTRLRGRIDGRIAASGTLDAPLMNGALSLRDGLYGAPSEKTEITGIGGLLTLAGTRATLTASASAGGGTLRASGTARLRSLRAPAQSTVALDLQAEHARVDLPGYFNGELNGVVTAARAFGEDAHVGGAIAISHARIPLDTFLKQKTGAPGGGGFNVGFANLRVTAGDDVRVQSGNVDIGATGGIALAGTLAKPSLSGSFDSSGGTLSFYRTFNLQSGHVAFSPSSGLIPDVDVVASTFVADPATAIRLHVTGPATGMNLALQSDPSYDRQQILGLLVGAQQLGAVQGVRSSGGGNFSAGSAAENVAAGQLNTIFTRTMLEPISSSVASALGFSEVQITTDVQTGLGVNAVKAFGKNVNAIWGQTFGYPRTQSITLDAHPSVATGLRLSAYTTSGPSLFFVQQPQAIGMDALQLNTYTVLPPQNGSNGVAFSFVRRFP